MSQPERWQDVHNTLKELRGLDPLKRLFWSELNYDRVNQPLSQRGWSATAREALAENPVLFAAHQDFHIIYARLDSDKLLLNQERPVISRLLQDHPYSLLVFSNALQEHWHFVNVKMADDPARRRLFRRITIGPNERLRTASERIALVDVGDREYSPLEVQELHDSAFDVEAVTRQFFASFAELYHQVADDIRALPGAEDEAGQLAQLLLNRMIFLYFIQKKGWLDDKPDYLYARFIESWKKDPQGSHYYKDVLYPLFQCLSNPDIKIDSVGVVPFLNGGLFEEGLKQAQSKRMTPDRLSIKDATFKVIFDDLLERYNFTITEDTPLDVEVAIDPEMLGKIFESLILELEQDPEEDLRKLTGSYYTPRPIVHFMCQQALKEYLVSQLANDEETAAAMGVKVETLLDLPKADQLDAMQLAAMNEMFTTREARNLRKAILDCRVCDPAVGSGAFPVGMLHEMVAAIGRLDARIEGADVIRLRNYDYQIKNQIIEFCLYGVDIQEQAVRLCELRLWLSLVVDYEIDVQKSFELAIREVPNLPNLSYRIMRGDSLLERLFGHVVQLDEMVRDEKALDLIEAIQRYKQAYFREGESTEKRRLELTILAKQADLAERLIEAKRVALTGFQTNMFGDDALTSKDRKVKAEHEERVHELDDLKRKVDAAKEELERLARKRGTPSDANLDALRRLYFKTGDAPTFMWNVDFAEVFSEQKGFDVIIANPPYVRVHRLSGDLKKMLWRHFQTFKAKADLYTCFIEQSIKLLREGGVVCFICSDGWQRLDSYDKLRELILASTLPRTLLDLRFDVFEEAKVKVSVFLFGRHPHPDHTESQSRFALANSADQIDTLEWRYIPVSHFISSYKLIFDTSWSESTEAITSKLKAEKPFLGDLLDVSFGLKTGDDSRFIVREKVDQNHMPLCRGENISRYRIAWAGEYVNYRPEEMRAHRSTARPGDKERFECEKVLVRDTGSRFECALDVNGYYVKDVLIVRSTDETIDLGYVATVLNSTLMRWFYERTFPTIHVQADELRSLPFIHPSTNEEAAMTLSKLGRKRQDLPDNEKAQLIDGEIDDVVFSLFGITNSDKEIIQKGP